MGAADKLRAELQAQADGIMQQARETMPRDRGSLASDTTVLRAADGWVARTIPTFDWTVTDSELARIKERWSHEPVRPDTVRWKCGEPLPVPVLAFAGTFDIDPDNPFAQVIRKHAEEALNGGHDWQEVDLASTGEVVAWYCRRCDEQKYAEGW